jgi:hypothetical protein
MALAVTDDMKQCRPASTSPRHAMGSWLILGCTIHRGRVPRAAGARRACLATRRWHNDPMTIRAMPWPLFALAALFLGACSARSKPVDDARQRWTIEQLPRTQAPTLATVKPPREPRKNHFHISEAKLAELPLPKQAETIWHG